MKKILKKISILFTLLFMMIFATKAFTAYAATNKGISNVSLNVISGTAVTVTQDAIINDPILLFDTKEFTFQDLQFSNFLNKPIITTLENNSFTTVSSSAIVVTKAAVAHYHEKPKITIHQEIIVTPTPKPTLRPTLKPTVKPFKPKNIKELTVPSKKELGWACMSYMNYTAINSKSSPQYKLQHWDKHVETDEETGVRIVTDSDKIKRVCVAMGTYYGKTGTKLKLEFSNGTSIYAIISDSKSDRGTDSTHRYHKYHDGTEEPGDHSVVEYIVGDSDKWKKEHQNPESYVASSYVTKVYYQGEETGFY